MYHVSIKQQFRGWDTEGIDTECTVVGMSALYLPVILDPQYSHRVCCISVITVMGPDLLQGYLIITHMQTEGLRMRLSDPSVISLCTIVTGQEMQ